MVEPSDSTYQTKGALRRILTVVSEQMDRRAAGGVISTPSTPNVIVVFK